MNSSRKFTPIIKTLVIATLLIGVLLAVYYFFIEDMKKGGLGILVVDSNPQGAQVYLDGIVQGRTPWRAEDIEVGYYSLKVADEEGGFGSWEGKVRIISDGETRVEQTLGVAEYTSGTVVQKRPSEERQDKLALTSSPAGAIVFLNGEDLGITPLIYLLEDQENLEILFSLENKQTVKLSLDRARQQSLIIDTKLATFPLLNFAVANQELPVESQAFDTAQIQDRANWQLFSSSCETSTCRTEKWMVLRLFKANLSGSDIQIGDWLKGLQVYGRYTLELPDYVFGYIIDNTGQIYQGTETKDLDYSFYTSEETELGLPEIDLSKFQFKAGDCPVIFLLPFGQEQVSDEALKAAGQLQQLINPTQVEKTQITIKDTPTGFLNLRSSPSLNASLVGKVYPGAVYELLEEKPSWYKIKVDESVEGWIYSQYGERK